MMENLKSGRHGDGQAGIGVARSAIGVGAVVVAVSPAWSFVGALGLALVTQLGLSNVDIGIAAGVASAGYVVMALPLGHWLDRVGDKWFLMGTPFIMGALFCTTAVVGTFTAFLILAFTGGGVWAGATTTLNRYVALVAPTHLMGRALGLTQASIMVAGALGAFALPWISLEHGWRTAVYDLAIISCLFGAVSVWAFHGRNVVVVSARPQKSRRGAWRLVGRNRLTPHLVALVAFGVVMGVAMNCTWTFMLPYLATIGGFEGAKASVGLALMFVCAAIGRFVAGLATDRILSTWWLLTLSAMTAAVCFVLLATLIQGLGVLLIVANLGIFFFGQNTPYLVAGLGLMPSSGWGFAAAILTMAHVVGGVIGPPMFALVVDRTGGYGMAWFTLAVVSLVSLVALFFAHPRRTYNSHGEAHRSEVE